MNFFDAMKELEKGNKVRNVDVMDYIVNEKRPL